MKTIIIILASQSRGQHSSYLHYCMNAQYTVVKIIKHATIMSPVILEGCFFLYHNYHSETTATHSKCNL